jgi:hypothetical protein
MLVRRAPAVICGNLQLDVAAARMFVLAPERHPPRAAGRPGSCTAARTPGIPAQG